MKKYLFLILILIFAGGALFWFLNRNTPAPTQQGGTVTLPSASSTPSGATSITTTGGTSSLSITGADGAPIQTNDFLHNPNTGQYPNAGYYYLGYHTPYAGVSDSTATAHPPYLIEYISATQYFNIELSQEPIGVARTQAEQYLMAELGISQSQMCALNYMVSVPISVNDFYAGRNLGFSFCPGATTLP